MKRWLVILLVVVALVVLVSPGIVGRLAERNMQQNIEWADSESPEVNIQTVSFERGWFSSEGRHRVELTRAADDSDEIPALIIETRFDHGLIPFTSMSHDEGSLAPGLARAVSTFQLEAANGELIDLPGSASTVIGLNGDADIHYELSQGSTQVDDAQVQWSGADIVARIDPSTRTTSIEGGIEPMTVQNDDGVVSVGAITVRGAQHMTDFGFGIGNGELEIGAVRFTATDGSGSGFDAFSLQGETGLDQGLVSGSYHMSVSGVNAPMLGQVSADVAFSISDLDAASVGRISGILDEAQAAADPSAAMAGVFPLIEKDLQTMLSAGGSLNIDRLDVSLPQGDVKTVVKVKFDKSDPAASFSWPALALLTTASADVRIPAMLVEMAAMMNPEAQQLITMGLLIQNGDAYEMQAEYAQGLMTINGAPFPIPLSGF